MTRLRHAVATTVLDSHPLAGLHLGDKYRLRSGQKGKLPPGLEQQRPLRCLCFLRPRHLRPLKIDCPEELCWQVYVRDMQTGNVTLASADSDGKPARTPGAVADPHGYPYGGGTSSPFGKGPTLISISDDGRYVVFSSYALNPSGEATLHRKDMQSGELSPVSAPPAVPQNLATFFLPAMSGDGRFIAYWTYSPALYQGGGEGAKLYIRDMTAAQSEVISLDGLPGGKDVILPDYT